MALHSLFTIFTVTKALDWRRSHRVNHKTIRKLLDHELAQPIIPSKNTTNERKEWAKLDQLEHRTSKNTTN